MIDLEPPSALAASESHLSLDSSFIGKQHWDTRRMFNGANMCTLDDLVDNVDPETVYSDFVLIAEGESGPMFAAKHIATGRLVSRWCEKGDRYTAGIHSTGSIPRLPSKRFQRLPHKS